MSELAKLFRAEQKLHADYNQFVMFAMNYPYYFIEECWAEDENLAKHLRSKFRGYYDQYGSVGAFNAFWCGLSTGNQRKLAKYINKTKL